MPGRIPKGSNSGATGIDTSSDGNREVRGVPVTPLVSPTNDAYAAARSAKSSNDSHPCEDRLMEQEKTSLMRQDCESRFGGGVEGGSPRAGQTGWSFSRNTSRRLKFNQ